MVLSMYPISVFSGGSNELQCEAACGNDGDDGGGILPAGTSTFCDPTCTAALDSRFGGYLCGAGDSERFGATCRMCYMDVEEARKAERTLSDSDGLHVVMCDTQRPPAALECGDKCGIKKDTVRACVLGCLRTSRAAAPFFAPVYISYIGGPI